MSVESNQPAATLFSLFHSAHKDASLELTKAINNSSEVERISGGKKSKFYASLFLAVYSHNFEYSQVHVVRAPLSKTC